ncbi:hypothetical protein [Blastopirellula marina]|uniref:Uncharacterized protein n=1 Tax=Blastopirellula marina TaxID=124 RepID=A0A2S8GQI8_9BACT|nr:hypothetical protein [Blastopirellula marina]PQO46696.1 hypothetical protein C5Y93_07630 [Blastopirellula marina]
MAYVVAAIMHVPVPVLDGDNLRSGEIASATASSTADDYDVDFILLGCDLPDDSDDGPVDDDPDDGLNSSFGPAYSIAKTGCQTLFSATGDHPAISERRCGAGAHRRLRGSPIEIAFRHVSFGKLCQSGTAHLRR